MTPLIDELWKFPRRLLNAGRVAGGELRPELARTPHRVVWQQGRVRVLAYDTVGPRKPCPVLMIPSIINRYYVLDLRPGQSFVESLAAAGIPVYLLDWGTVTPKDRYATLDDHAVRWIGAALRATCKDFGSARAHLLGYCIGGTLAAIHAAVRPERVAGLIGLTAPIGFHDPGLLSCFGRAGALPVERIERELGNMSGEFLRSSFAMIQPTAVGRKLSTFADRLWDDAFVERFLALETWVNDCVDVPGPTYRRLLRDLYEGDRFARNELAIDGRTVRVEDIACPVLAAVSPTDHIVPEASARILYERASHPDRTLLRLDGGHIGVTVGSAAPGQLWRSTREWLEARPVDCIGRNVS